MKRIIKELETYDIKIEDVSVISDKDGVMVYRVKSDDRSYVLKYFSKKKYRREIQHYAMLQGLNIPTIRTFGSTESSILLEDIRTSDQYRLATPEDLENAQVITALAKYYKALHHKGKMYLDTHGNTDFYSELDWLTRKNIEMVKQQSGYHNSAYWTMLNQLLISLEDYFQQKKTITYNDFFYGNMIVSKDLKEAFMFDYNFLGEGLKYFDVSNVISQLTPSNKKLFIMNYGSVNGYEIEVNRNLSHIIALVIAYQRDVFPNWAKVSLEKLNSGELYESLQEFVRDYMSS